jgi:hypothetical protein
MNGLQILVMSIVVNAAVLGIVVWLTYELNRLVQQRGR